MALGAPGPGHAAGAEGVELYFYWRATAACAAAARAATAAFQHDAMAAHPGLQARLLQRADAPADGDVTLMEIYRLPATGIDAATAHWLRERGDGATAAWRTGPRHEERFIGVG
jgi:hypothetical protein